MKKKNVIYEIIFKLFRVFKYFIQYLVKPKKLKLLINILDKITEKILSIKQYVIL